MVVALSPGQSAESRKSKLRNVATRLTEFGDLSQAYQRSVTLHAPSQAQLLVLPSLHLYSLALTIFDDPNDCLRGISG